jgi:hypothetical protein
LKVKHLKKDLRKLRTNLVTPLGTPSRTQLGTIANKIWHITLEAIKVKQTLYRMVTIHFWWIK